MLVPCSRVSPAAATCRHTCSPRLIPGTPGSFTALGKDSRWPVIPTKGPTENKRKRAVGSADRKEFHGGGGG